jgi:N-acetylglutamate synthase-like GNAT family acetyltransferase
MPLTRHVTHAKQLYNDLDKNVFTTLYKKDRLIGQGNHNHHYEDDFPFSYDKMYFTTFEGSQNWVLNVIDKDSIEDRKVAVDFGRYFFLLSLRTLNALWLAPENERAYKDREEYVLALRNEYFYLYSVIHPQAKIKKAYLNLFMINPYLKRGGFGGALLKWYEQYLRETFGIEYVYLVPLKRPGVDDAYTYWNKMGFDYVKDPDLMKLLTKEKDAASTRKEVWNEMLYESTPMGLPPGNMVVLKKDVAMEPERKSAKLAFSDRQHPTVPTGEKAAYVSSSMWKKITDNPSVYVEHENKKFDAYLKAVPTIPVTKISFDFHYTVDVTSETYMKKVDGPLPKGDEYTHYRSKLECLAIPILVYKLNTSRGFPAELISDTARCDEIYGTNEETVDKEEAKQLFDSFIAKDKKIAEKKAQPAQTVPEPVLPTDFLANIPTPAPQQDFIDIENDDLKKAIQAQALASRPRLRPRESLRSPERDPTPVKPPKPVRPPPELIDLTLDEEENEPPRQRRRIETETEAAAATKASSAAATRNTYGGPATAESYPGHPYISSLLNAVGGVEGVGSPERTALKYAIYQMRKRYERLPMAGRGTFDDFVKKNESELKLIFESQLAHKSAARASLRP